ncbi:MAG: hypothetical protein K8U03_03340 [Planctomycetia bacterium]|nr:hypothetical protein [Planctomycetia bacterium]
MDTSVPVPPSASFPSPAPRPKSKWRWVRRIGLATTLVVVGLIGAAPTIVSKNPELRDRLIRRFLGDLNGDVVIKDFSVGWFSPLTIRGLALHPRSDSQPVPGSSANREPLITAEAVEADRDLWRMLWDRADVGTIRIERPQVFLALGEKGQSNFSEVFGPILEREAKTPRSLTFGARAQIVDGTLRGISAETREPWQIAGINLAVGVRSAQVSKSGKPELFVERGNLVSKGALTVGLCNDVLKYIAPVVAKTASVRGLVSIDLDDWRLPWKDFGSGDLSGRLTMHTVEVGPGAMTKSILHQAALLPFLGDLMRSLPAPDFVNIAHDSVIVFKMLPGGRLHHEGLRFSLADLIDVQTHGSVGLDETLDLVASLGIHPPNPEERKLALMRQLSSQQWPVNIRGKLGAPAIDLSPLGVAWKQLLFQKVPADWLSGRSSFGGNLMREIPPETVGQLMSLYQWATAPTPAPRSPASQTPTLGDGSVNQNAVPPLPVPSATAPAFGPAEGVKLGLDMLQAIRARRQQQPPPTSRPLAPQDQQSPAPRDRIDPVPPANGSLQGNVNPPASGPTGFLNGVPNAAPTGAPPRRPLLRQGLRMLLEAAESANQPASTTQPPAPQPPTPANPAP